MKSLFRSAVAQTALAILLGWYLRFALATTRWTVAGPDHAAPYLAGHAGIVAFWHERLPMMPAFWLMTRRRNRAARVHVLVSRHRDGRLIGTLMRQFAMDTVHGSTSRGGAAGLRQLADRLAAGDLVAITPDGPRGPRRQAAAGVAQLASLAGLPVLLPCAARTTRGIVLGSWDRMVVPLPFGRGVVACAAPVPVARDNWEDALPAIAAGLTARPPTRPTASAGDSHEPCRAPLHRGDPRPRSDRHHPPDRGVARKPARGDRAADGLVPPHLGLADRAGETPIPMSAPTWKVFLPAWSRRMAAIAMTPKGRTTCLHISAPS